MKTRFFCHAFFCGLLFALCGSVARAQYFPNNATINYPINAAVIGYANASDYNHGVNGLSPTVALVNGGSVATSLQVYNHSVVNMSGGSVLSSLQAYDASIINMSGGIVTSNLYANNVSVVNLSGGSIGGALYAYNSASFNLFGVGLSSKLTDRAANLGLYSQYTLSGKLADGTVITGKLVYLRNQDSANFTLVNVSGAVNGQIALEGVPDQTQIVTPVGAITFEFRTPGTSPYNSVMPVPALFTRTGLLTPDASQRGLGDYSVTGVLPGTYDIGIKSRGGLRVVIKNITVGAGAVTLPQVLLRSADANNDNSVDATDFGLFVGAYNTFASVPGSGYDPAADFNYDGSVDATDFGLLVGEYNSMGDL